MKFLTWFFVAVISVSAGAQEKDGVYFISPKDGATVRSAFRIKFGLKGKTLRPAGEDVKDKTSGHHHLIIDKGFVPEGEVVPADDHHIHFGKAQTGVIQMLSKGKHTLTLQLADGAHVSYGEPYSKTIEITVK